MKRAARSRTTAAAARGAAALVVVMVLFFIMSLVAAYASRNLIFEQRTSANNYRSTQALEAAEAGLDWAVAMLNGGRIDAACQPTNDGVSTPFRERYLQALGNGEIQVRPWPTDTVSLRIRAACVRSASGWVCSCPDSGSPTLSAPGGAGPAPAFRVAFETVAGQPDLVKVVSRGCSSLGNACDASVSAGADAYAEITAQLALTPALTQVPAAALMVRGGLARGDARFVADVPGAVAIYSGGAVTPAITDANLGGPPGTPLLQAVIDRLVVVDSTLSIAGNAGLSAGERFFLATFGVPPDALRLQPAVHRLSCGAECRQTLQEAADAHPGRILWIDGDLNIGADAPLILGSTGAQVILVVDGNLNFASGSTAAINGLVYSRGTRLDATSATAVTLYGALIAEGDPASTPIAGGFTIIGAPQLQYDVGVVSRAREVVARQVLDFGSFTRVPGSWRDFGS